MPALSATGKSGLARSLSGIKGLDLLTGGGLPRGRATVISGGPGAGKTVFALQALVEGARQFGEPGVFVAFEESRERLLANSRSFGWPMAELQRRKLLFLEAKLPLDLAMSGSFEVEGLLASLDVLVRRIKARRVVFDAVDVVTSILGDATTGRREIERIHEWTLRHDLTTIFTAKAAPAGGREMDPLNLLQYMTDCVVQLETDMSDGLAQRSIRVSKFRGARCDGNAMPYVIAERGVEVVEPATTVSAWRAASSERLSTGIDRLDTMLGDGVHRGSCTLVTGSPGTAKTTLAASFASARCAAGERVLFVSFDSEPGEIVRNMASVSIRLAPHIRSGRLRIISERSRMRSAELQFMHLRQLTRDFGARHLIVDPLSALGKAGLDARTHAVVERLIDWAHTEGITLFCTSLLDGPDLNHEGSAIQISTIADTWIHLSYLVRSGERNRALTIVKSRGTAHSNQVRELILDDRGVSMADAYLAGGEVLMGTLRWEHEQRVARADAEQAADVVRQREAVDDSVAEIGRRIASLRAELRQRRTERAELGRGLTERAAERVASGDELRRLRHADSARATRE